jgi:hypothetical protein
VKARSAAVQGAIAAGALALAVATWLRVPETATSGRVVIAELTSGSVQSVVWDDGSHRVEVERVTQGQPEVWVRIARSPSLLAPDAGVDAGAPAPADAGAPPVRAVDAGAHADAGPRADGGPSALELAPPAPDRELRGNETAEKLLEQFSPFTATRALGVPDAAKLRELGLDSGLRRLDVWTQARHLSFEVSTPVGTGASYVRTEDGRVYVLGGTVVQDLAAAASRLVDRRVHAFRPEDADRVVVRLGSQSRTLVQKRVGGSAKVFNDVRADTPDAYAQAWLDRLNKVVPTDVLGRGEVPPEGEPHGELRVDFLRGSQGLGFIELARAQNGWFARSEHSVGWMRVVGRAEGLVHDAEHVVSTP